MVCASNNRAANDNFPLTMFETNNKGILLFYSQSCECMPTCAASVESDVRFVSDMPVDGATRLRRILPQSTMRTSLIAFCMNSSVVTSLVSVKDTFRHNGGSAKVVLWKPQMF